MSLEITNDPPSERFRDVVAKAFLEVLGSELQYGPWTVTLRSNPRKLSIVMTGPGDTRHEWAFDIVGADAFEAVADQLRRSPWKRSSSF